MEALKLILIFAAIVIALRRNVSIGVTLFGAGLLTAVIYWLPVDQLLEGYRDLLTSRRFLSLTGVIVSITVLGNLLKESGYLGRLTKACQGLRGGSRTAAIMMPALVGLMPMPAGSYLSAPLVNSVLDHDKHSPHFRCAVNYWFRHMVEFSWPVYPGLILTEAITGMPIATVSLLQFPMTVIMFILGLIFLARHIDTSGTNRQRLWSSIVGIAGAIWPVVLAIALYGILKIELFLAMVVSLILVMIVTRSPRSALFLALRKGLSPKLVFLVFGILSFQMVLELTGSIESIPRLAEAYNLPESIVIILVCFTAGLLTGMVAAYVGLGYTLLAGLLYQPVLNPANILLAYLSGFIGMMLSPTHLCLIVTNEYFGSDLSKVYKVLAIPVLLLGVFGFLLYISGYGSLIG